MREIMAEEKLSVFGIFSTRNAAENGADAIMQAGSAASDISILLLQNVGTRMVAAEQGTKAPEGATAGDAIGLGLGGALGLLADIGALAIPGVGPLIAAGPIMTTLAGMGAGSAIGGMVGALVFLGIPEYEAKHYAGRIQRGGLLLSVYCATSDEAKRAKGIMERTGAEEISSPHEASADTSERAMRCRAGGVE